ncbi:tetratricopeptide repeat protein 29 isoform X3 [Antennarius striatus]
METLKVHLSRAERAERTGLWAVACDQRLFLGGFFSSPEDVWLRFHFYHSCCQTGRPLRPAAEARACLAELLLQQGDLDQARQQAECYLEQAGDEDWLDSSGRPLRLRVHQSLWRIYSRLADALLTDAPPEGANYSEALMLLHKGQRLATEADNKQMEGEASYQLGLTYQRAGDHDSAKQFFNRCVQIYSVLQDADGQVMAYKAMAKSIESQGHTHETVQCLEKLVDISHSNGLQHSLADAHLSLGSIHYKRKHHIRACQSFLGGYQVARQLEDVDLLQRAQVLVAISRAQSLIRTFSAQVDCSGATPTDLRPLLAWRETSNHQDLDSECVDPVATAWDQILVGEGPDP